MNSPTVAMRTLERDLFLAAEAGEIEWMLTCEFHMYVYMYVPYVCMYVFIFMHVCMLTCEFHMYVCMYVCIYILGFAAEAGEIEWMLTCEFHMYVCMYIPYSSMCVFIYMNV